jgi:hypothetical protein
MKRLNPTRNDGARSVEHVPPEPILSDSDESDMYAKFEKRDVSFMLNPERKAADEQEPADPKQVAMLALYASVRQFQDDTRCQEEANEYAWHPITVSSVEHIVKISYLY